MAMDIQTKWHASLMIFGWVCCVTSGLLVARFAKPFWPRYKIMGVQIWFMAHRVFMVLGWLAIVTSLVIIYIKAGHFKTNSHAMIGYFSGTFATLQIANSFFRPAPDSPHRWIFNYGHWVLGMIAHIIALNNIFRSVFGRGATFQALILAYIFLYITISDLFRKLDSLAEKYSAIHKTMFLGGVSAVNALGAGLIVSIIML